MAVSISLLALTAAGVYVLCRYAGLAAWHALVCVLLGFLLASSSLAPEISRLLANLVSINP